MSYDICDSGNGKKFRIILTVFFFFQKGRKNNGKALISIKCCYSWKLQWPLVLMFELPGSVFAYDNENCQDHQFLLLKLQDQCLVTVSRKTLNIAL